MSLWVPWATQSNQWTPKCLVGTPILPSCSKVQSKYARTSNWLLKQPGTGLEAELSSLKPVTALGTGCLSWTGEEDVQAGVCSWTIASLPVRRDPHIFREKNRARCFSANQSWISLKIIKHSRWGRRYGPAENQVSQHPEGIQLPLLASLGTVHMQCTDMHAGTSNTHKINRSEKKTLTGAIILGSLLIVRLCKRCKLISILWYATSTKMSA